MIGLTEVITSSGTTTLVFELSDKDGRESNVAPGTATISLRKQGTPRTSHELPQLPALFDPVSATVTLDLSSDQTAALTPPFKTTVETQDTVCVGDIRIVQGAEVNYYGPFLFTIRLPETFKGQAVPVQTLTVVGGLSADNVPETAELTIAVVGDKLVFPPLRDQYQLIWRLGTEPDLTSVVYASDTTFLNQISNFVLWPHEVTLTDGRRGKVLVSIQRLTYIADTLELR